MGPRRWRQIHPGLELTWSDEKIKNQYVPTRDGVNKAIDDINIFHKEAIKADLIKQKWKPVKTLTNGLIKNAKPSEKTKEK